MVIFSMGNKDLAKFLVAECGQQGVLTLAFDTDDTDKECQGIQVVATILLRLQYIISSYYIETGDEISWIESN